MIIDDYWWLLRNDSEHHPLTEQWPLPVTSNLIEITAIAGLAIADFVSIWVGWHRYQQRESYPAWLCHNSELEDGPVEIVVIYLAIKWWIFP